MDLAARICALAPEAPRLSMVKSSPGQVAISGPWLLGQTGAQADDLEAAVKQLGGLVHWLEAPESRALRPGKLVARVQPPTLVVELPVAIAQAQ